MRSVLIAVGFVCAVFQVAAAVELPSVRYQLAEPLPEASLQLPAQDTDALLAEDLARNARDLLAFVFPKSFGYNEEFSTSAATQPLALDQDD